MCAVRSLCGEGTVDGEVDRGCDLVARGVGHAEVEDGAGGENDG